MVSHGSGVASPSLRTALVADPASVLVKALLACLWFVDFVRGPFFVKAEGFDG